MSSQYSGGVAAPAFQLNVTVLPDNTELGAGDDMTAVCEPALNEL
jgi:hypothetical protein